MGSAVGSVVGVVVVRGLTGDERGACVVDGSVVVGIAVGMEVEEASVGDCA